MQIPDRGQWQDQDREVGGNPWQWGNNTQHVLITTTSSDRRVPVDLHRNADEGVGEEVADPP